MLENSLIFIKLAKNNLNFKGARKNRKPDFLLLKNHENDVGFF